MANHRHFGGALNQFEGLNDLTQQDFIIAGTQRALAAEQVDLDLKQRSAEIRLEHDEGVALRVMSLVPSRNIASRLRPGLPIE